MYFEEFFEKLEAPYSETEAEVLVVMPNGERRKVVEVEVNDEGETLIFVGDAKSAV
jgi:acyl-coenzyme A thioesterase PaaI-like protein